MTDFRSITNEDVPAVTEYALRVLRAIANDERLRVAPMKVQDAVRYFARTSGHFNLAAFDDKLCVGAIAAFAGEMAYFERQEAHVMFCHATLPGVGMKLIREMMAWVRSEPRLRRIVWAMNPSSVGERTTNVLGRRLGFKPLNLLAWTKE